MTHEPRRETTPDHTADPQLRSACFNHGRSVWSRIRWDEAGFLAAWEAHDGHVEGSEAALADEYLRLACLARAPGAVEALEAEYLATLRPFLVKRCGDADIADEGLQQLRHKLLLGDNPRLGSYRSTGHLRAWLQVVAVRLCQDVARQRGGRWERETPLVEQLVQGGTEPHSRLEKGELDELFVEALREVVRGLPEQERYALRMHVLAGWNVSQIGEALDTHRATAARWIVRAKERLNENVRALLRERLDLPPDEIERIFALLSTQLDLRLSQVFNATPHLGCPEEQTEPDGAAAPSSGDLANPRVSPRAPSE